MAQKNKKISLGFTQQEFEPGVHICQIFGSDEEREDALLNFLLSGIQGGERTSCFSEIVDEELLTEFFEKNNLNFKDFKTSGTFTLSGTRDVYYEGGRFDPERMLDILTQYYEDALEQNYPGARVIGEMTADVQDIPGGSQLLEYEAKVSLLQKTHPVTAVCQYDARSFEGGMIMDILKVHPYMVVRGSVVHNPFFIPPEEYLAQID